MIGLALAKSLVRCKIGQQNTFNNIKETHIYGGGIHHIHGLGMHTRKDTQGGGIHTRETNKG